MKKYTRHIVLFLVLLGVLVVMMHYHAYSKNYNEAKYEEVHLDNELTNFEMPNVYTKETFLVPPPISIEVPELPAVFLKEDIPSSTSVFQSSSHLPFNKEKIIRGVYIPKSKLNSKVGRENIDVLLNSTRINALVIDIKDSTGYVFLPSQDEKYSFTSDPYTQNALEYIQAKRKEGVYIIGRIVIFQDPLLPSRFPEYTLHDIYGAIWKDRKGLAFLDPQNNDVLKRTIDLSIRAYNLPIDEINFDYIRFPSDGKISEIAYNLPEGKTKADVMEDFFKKLHDELVLKHSLIISADLFGDVIRIPKDPGIGQVYEKALPYFHSIAPMVYPSHFSPGSYGIHEPGKYPTEMMQGIAQSTKTRFEAWCSTLLEEQKTTECTQFKNRPWIQDFSMGGVYGVTEVRGQIKALEDAGITSWLVWNPSGRYTLDALK